MSFKLVSLQKTKMKTASHRKWCKSKWLEAGTNSRKKLWNMWMLSSEYYRQDNV